MVTLICECGQKAIIRGDNIGTKRRCLFCGRQLPQPTPAQLARPDPPRQGARRRMTWRTFGCAFCLISLTTVMGLLFVASACILLCRSDSDWEKSANDVRIPPVPEPVPPARELEPPEIVRNHPELGEATALPFSGAITDAKGVYLVEFTDEFRERYKGRNSLSLTLVFPEQSSLQGLWRYERVEVHMCDKAETVLHSELLTGSKDLTWSDKLEITNESTFTPKMSVELPLSALGIQDGKMLSEKPIAFAAKIAIIFPKRIWRRTYENKQAFFRKDVTVCALTRENYLTAIDYSTQMSRIREAHRLRQASYNQKIVEREKQIEKRRSLKAMADPRQRYPIAITVGCLGAAMLLIVVLRVRSWFRSSSSRDHATR